MISNLRNLRPKTSAAFWAGATRGWSARDVSSSQSRTVPVAGMRAVTTTTIGGSPFSPDRPATSDDVRKGEGNRRHWRPSFPSHKDVTSDEFHPDFVFCGMDISNRAHRRLANMRRAFTAVFRLRRCLLLLSTHFQGMSRSRTGGGAARVHNLHQPISQIKP